MKLLAKYLIVVVSVIGFSSILPKLYDIAFSERPYNDIVNYSAVLQDFIFSTNDSNGDTIFVDSSGKEYELKEYMRMLPFSYYTNLLNMGVAPTELNGVTFNRGDVVRENKRVGITPSKIDSAQKYIKLHLMFESVTEIASIVLPDHMFSIHKSVTFYDPKTNSIDEEKSLLFTNAFIEEGFKFPPNLIAGNEDTRKPYDFGFFITDSNDDVFHVIQVNGQPIVVKTPIETDSKIIYMFVEENTTSYFGFLVTDNGNVYRISKENYELEKLYLENYDPRKHGISYRMNVLNIVTRVASIDSDRYYVSDKDLQPVAFYEKSRNKSKAGIVKSVYDVIFPFTLLESSYTKYKMPQFVLSDNFKHSIMLSFFIAICYVAIMRRKSNVIDVVLIMATGIYALITITMMILSEKYKYKI